MSLFRFQISSEQEEERIDRCIASLMDSLSRSYIQKMIREGYVEVNGKAVRQNFRVSADDEVAFFLPEAVEPEILPEEIPLDILYEDDDLLVVNKPKGMVVHPAAGHYSHTLVNAVLFHCKGQLSGINGVLRPGIVHRIDKDTTGLIIVAKNDAAHLDLSQQLQRKSVSRLYYALVHGDFAHDHGTIDAPIGRDEKDRQKMAVTEKNSRDARTHFRVIERFRGFTLVECRLETGRTHQIRVHMRYIGHPVAGDEKYGYRKTLKTGGQLLHAHQLEFIHPRTKEKVVVEAPLPDDFAAVLKTLREERDAG